MTDTTITPALGPLSGEVRLPTDKSISHRAVLVAAMAEGESDLVGVLDSADVHATLEAVQALGAEVALLSAGTRGLRVRVTGWGAAGPSAPAEPIDCRNSGTTARLLMGVLAGWPIEVTLTGDESLSRRPMERVAAPLRAMGADIQTAEGGTLPVRIRGGALRASTHVLPVASAQVKTALLLAGLRAEGRTAVTEPAASRDHTERMLPVFGVPVEREGLTAAVIGPAVPTGTIAVVPADPSSAAFMCAAALLVPGSEVIMPGVSLNPGRAGFIEVLRRMGADISVEEPLTMGEEPTATLIARHGRPLTGTTVVAEEVPALIDEVPVLALVATQAEGVTRFEDVGELRVKESDRLELVSAGLRMLGARVETGADWLEVHGPSTLRGARLSASGDHRLAMMWAIAGLIARGVTEIEGFEVIDVSYPAFAFDLERLRGEAWPL